MCSDIRPTYLIKKSTIVLEHNHLHAFRILRSVHYLLPAARDVHSKLTATSAVYNNEYQFVVVGVLYLRQRHCESLLRRCEIKSRSHTYRHAYKRWARSTFYLISYLCVWYIQSSSRKWVWIIKNYPVNFHKTFRLTESVSIIRLFHFKNNLL